VVRLRRLHGCHGDRRALLIARLDPAGRRFIHVRTGVPQPRSDHWRSGEVKYVASCLKQFDLKDRVYYAEQGGWFCNIKIAKRFSSKENLIKAMHGFDCDIIEVSE
jgi:hypothetical protein